MDLPRSSPRFAGTLLIVAAFVAIMFFVGCYRRGVDAIAQQPAAAAPKWEHRFFPVAVIVGGKQDINDELRLINEGGWEYGGISVMDIRTGSMMYLFKRSRQ